MQAQVAASFSNDSENMPKREISAGTDDICDILVSVGLAKSRGEARRLAEGGGVRVNDKVVEAGYQLDDGVKADGKFVLHKGKKVHLLIEIK